MARVLRYTSNVDDGIVKGQLPVIIIRYGVPSYEARRELQRVTQRDLTVSILTVRRATLGKITPKLYARFLQRLSNGAVHQRLPKF